MIALPTDLRVDKWLWFARFYKSRSLAQAMVEAGEVVLNGRVIAKAAQTVRPGDELVFPSPTGKRRLRVRILALGTRRGPAPEAQALYQQLDITAGEW